MPDRHRQRPPAFLGDAYDGHMKIGQKHLALLPRHCQRHSYLPGIQTLMGADPRVPNWDVGLERESCSMFSAAGAPPGSWLADRVVVVPVPGTRRPHPRPGALGRVIGPRPSRGAVESLLGLPRYRAVDLVVAAAKHAALVLRLPLLLDDPRVRVEVVRKGGPGSAGLVEARSDGALEAGVARREYVAHACRMRASRQHEGQRDERRPTPEMPAAFPSPGHK